jgi:hypothetical protein
MEAPGTGLVIPFSEIWNGKDHPLQVHERLKGLSPITRPEGVVKCSGGGQFHSDSEGLALALIILPTEVG